MNKEYKEVVDIINKLASSGFELYRYDPLNYSREIVYDADCWIEFIKNNIEVDVIPFGEEKKVKLYPRINLPSEWDCYKAGFDSVRRQINNAYTYLNKEAELIKEILPDYKVILFDKEVYNA